MHNLKGLLGAAALTMAMASSGAASADVLGWSFSATGVGSCDLGGGCSPAHAPVYTMQTFQYGANMNAQSSAADPNWGLAHGSANPGTGPLPLPQLHSDVTGANTTGPAYSWNYSQVQGAIGFTTKGALALDLNDFVGNVHFTNSANGVGLASVSLAILDGTAGSDHAIGDSWYAADGTYGFANDCNSPAALAIGETGYNFSKGSVNSVLSVAACGSSIVTLAAGDTIYLWARMMTFEAGNGFVDASHTFDIALRDNLAPEVVQQLTDNLVPTTFSVGVPEPATWALLLLGFGGIGGALRARRRTLIDA